MELLVVLGAEVPTGLSIIKILIITLVKVLLSKDDVLDSMRPVDIISPLIRFTNIALLD